MNKQELVKVMRGRTGLTADQVLGFFKEYEDVVKSALSEGDKVPLPGFGTFQMKERSARKARNPKTGEMFMVEANKVPVLRFAPSVKNEMKQVVE